jgi:glycine oxidase
MADHRFDAVILGGGIIGCALAEELARRGRRVQVLERGRIGAEASSAAAGILAAQMDIPQAGPFFDFCQAARQVYPGWIRRIERRSGVPVGFHVDSILYLALTGPEDRRMAAQVKWQRAKGLRAERWSAAEVRRQEPAVDGRIRAGYVFPTEAQVDNARLMTALSGACRTGGVAVREGVAVRRLVIRNRRIQEVVTNQGAFAAPIVVNCLGSWANLGGQFPVRLPIEPARGQILVFQGAPGLYRRAIMSSKAYLVQRRDGRVITGSTIERAGFQKALTVDGMHSILCGARSISRAVGQCTFVEAWAGFRPLTTPDQLPILGGTAVDGLYVATGHYRHGILLAPITAMAMADLVVKGRSPIDLSAFSPTRF